MAKLTISDAARVAGVARSTLHRAMHAGRLSADPDGQIDTAELLRAGYTLQWSTQHPPDGALQNATPRSRSTQHPLPSAPLQPVNVLQQERDLLRMERDLLRQALDAAQMREQTALEREQAAREREALLLRMLEQVQQQNTRLLDTPRPAPLVETAPAPVVARPAAPTPTADVDRGTTRRRILALLEGYPEGLSTTEIRVLLGMQRPLVDTCMGMMRDGLLYRISRGRYRAHTG